MTRGVASLAFAKCALSGDTKDHNARTHPAGWLKRNGLPNRVVLSNPQVILRPSRSLVLRKTLDPASKNLTRRRFGGLESERR